MAITKYPPRTIWLGGPRTEIGDVPAGEAITPGMLIERYDAGAGVSKFRKNATADSQGKTYATEQSMVNKGVDDAYAAGDLVEATVGSPGTTIWALVASGANLAAGAKLGNAGNGYLRAVGSGVHIATALEAVNNSAGPGTSRIRVEVV